LREETSTTDREAYHRIERLKGNFYRRFALPDTADSENIIAKSRNGVLEVTIDKKKALQPRRIEVKLAD
jgi:HSP20 family protein